MLKSLFPWKHHKTKAMAAQQTMDDVVPEDPSPAQPLLPCHVCGRTFLSAPLKKHERICEKSTVKKRKPFDSLRQRVTGTDLADFHQKTYLKKPEPVPLADPKKHSQNNWKAKHLELVNTIRAAKGVPATSMSNTKIKSTTSLMAGNERCPSCDRQFGPKAFDRHVEWCKEKKAQQRIHHSPANNVLIAKERLEARTKYVPTLNKAKKMAVRDKYSNQNTSTSTETLASVKSVSPLSRGPSVRKPRSEVNLGRGSDKASQNGEKERPRVEKSVGSHGDKLKRQESVVEKIHTPVIASKGDAGKNSQKKKGTPYMKINDTHINQIDGISVASLKFDYTNKKMVTWRDTVGTSSEDKIDEKVPIKSCPKVKNSNGNSTQSVTEVASEAEKINCEKILSSSDVLHKDPTKIPLSKHMFSKQLNTDKLKEKFTNEDQVELEITSNQIKTTSVSNSLPKKIDVKKIIKKSNKKMNKFDLDSIEMNRKDLDPITQISLNAKIESPVYSNKKTFAKKINKTQLKLVEGDKPEICKNPSEKLSPDSLKGSANKKIHVEKLSGIEEHHITSNKGTMTQNSDVNKEKTTRLLKSHFTKKLNTDKLLKKIVIDEDTVEVSTTPRKTEPITLRTENAPPNLDLLYKNNLTQKVINKFNITDPTGEEPDLSPEIRGKKLIEKKIITKFNVTSENTDGGNNDTITSKFSEVSMSSNCSTVNSEETYLINQSSTDEFNTSQNFGNPSNSEGSLLQNNSIANLTDTIDNNNSVENNVYEKIGGRFLSVESNDKCRLKAIVDSNSSITVNSSVLDVKNCSQSCNSVTEAFQKLAIDSKEEFDSTTAKDTDTETVETNNLVEDKFPVDSTTMFGSFRNTHKEFTNWFDEYMKKNDTDGEEEHLDDQAEYPPEREIAATSGESQETCEEPLEKAEEKTKSENLVLIFKSTTDLDLTCDINDSNEKKTITEEFKLKDRISEETIGTSCDLDSFDLNHNKPSNFSIKKSMSDIDITTTSSILGISGKNTLISIYYNKNKENFDNESLSETRRTRTKSLPNIYLVEHITVSHEREETETGRRKKSGSGRPKPQVEVNNGSCSEEIEKKLPVDIGNKHIINKNDVLDERENLRRKILELAAEEFIEDCRENDSLYQDDDDVIFDPIYGFPDEEYTVPKKKRRVDSCNNSGKTKGAQFSNVNFDLRRFKAMTLSENESFDENAMGDFLKKDGPPESNDTRNDLDRDKRVSTGSKSRRSNASSGSTKISAECSPRLATILDKVLNPSSSGTAENSKALVVVTLNDCLKLAELDKRKLPKIKKHLEKLKNKHTNKWEGVKLPPIGNKGSEDKEIQAGLDEEEITYLPKIMDKFIRRGVLKKCTTDVRTGVRDVYLEYDGDSNNSLTYDPFELAQRQFMELLDCDDFKSLGPTSTPVKHTPRLRTTSATTPTKQPSPTTKKKIKSAGPILAKVNRNNRASVIDPPISFKDSLDSITDDFELMEILIKDQFIDDNKNSKNSFYLHLNPEKESLTLSDILDNRKYSDELSIDPRLINENDNLSIPEHFKIDDYSPTSTADTDITLQNDVDHYSVQYDNKISEFELKPDKKQLERKPAEKKPIVKRSNSLVNRCKTDEGSLRVSNKKLTTKSKLTSRSVSSMATSKVASSEKKKGLSTLKKTNPLFDQAPKPPSLKNKEEVDNYFSEKQQKNWGADRSSPEKDPSDAVEEALKPDDLFAVDDEMYEEYKKYEEMYLKEKAQSSTTKKNKPKLIDINFGILTASEEEEQSMFNKISNDSAYGSLTRKTPKHRSRATKLTPLEQKQADSSSSSGSEHCPNSPAIAQRLSKFCHECGNKYPLSTAKFCVECGVKRLVL